jgi:hypothetical protein
MGNSLVSQAAPALRAAIATSVPVVDGDYVEGTNSLTEEVCQKQAIRCLEKEGVCGEFFESCTTISEFNMQKGLCNDTFTKCTEKGRIKLFDLPGTTSSIGGKLTSLVPQCKSSATTTENKCGEFNDANSNLYNRMMKGLDYALKNAETTCSKIANNCFVSACEKNPLMCQTDTDKYDLKNAACKLIDGSECSDGITPKKVVRNNCLSIIGNNSACKLQFGETDSDDVFDSVMGKYFLDFKGSLSNMIIEFSNNAKVQCTSAIQQCISQGCGGGNGLVCYQLTGGKNATQAAIEKQIGTSCNGLDKTNLACAYYAKIDTVNNKITSLVGEAANKYAVELNSSFNETTAKKMEVACLAATNSCVQEKCGDNYFGCTINKAGDTDGLTVKLNENVVKGFCWNDVLDNSNCNAYFQILAATLSPDGMMAGWNNSSISPSMGGGTTCGMVPDPNCIPNSSATPPVICGMVPDPKCTAIPDTDQSNKGFRLILTMIEKTASAERNSKYLTNRNRCEAGGGLWKQDQESGGGIVLSSLVDVTTAKMSDTCWLKNSITVEGDAEIVKDAGNKLNTDFYLPAGSTGVCGASLDDSKVTGLIEDLGGGSKSAPGSGKLGSEKMGWGSGMIIAATSIAGAVGGGYGGYKIADAIKGDQTNSALTVARNNLTSAKGRFDGYTEASSDNKSSPQCSVVKTAIESANAAIESANAAITKSDNADNVKSYKITGEISNLNCTATNDAAAAAAADAARKAVKKLNEAIDQVGNAIDADKKNVDKDKKGLGSGQSIGMYIGAGVGGVGAGLGTYAIMDAARRSAASEKELKYIERLEQALGCRVQVLGGGTRRVALGDSFTIPAM